MPWRRAGAAHLCPLRHEEALAIDLLRGRVSRRSVDQLRAADNAQRTVSFAVRTVTVELAKGT